MEELSDRQPPQMRVWPRSAAVELNVTYRKGAFIHCGLDYLFDFDESFWEISSVPDDARNAFEDPWYDDGLVRLIDHATAIYETAVGVRFTLARRDGPREVGYCE